MNPENIFHQIAFVMLCVVCAVMVLALIALLVFTAIEEWKADPPWIPGLVIVGAFFALIILGYFT